MIIPYLGFKIFIGNDVTTDPSTQFRMGEWLKDKSRQYDPPTEESNYKCGKDNDLTFHNVYLRWLTLKVHKEQDDWSS